jgi:uncharacterized protein
MEPAPVMAKRNSKTLRCPTCRALVLAGDENFPFCSDRCRLIDLGKWASGSYVISTPVTDPEQLENQRAESPGGLSTAGSSHRDGSDDH